MSYRLELKDGYAITQHASGNERITYQLVSTLGTEEFTLFTSIHLYEVFHKAISYQSRTEEVYNLSSE